MGESLDSTPGFLVSKYVAYAHGIFKGFLVYRVTRRVFSEPVTSKLHILSPNILAGHLKASEVTWISAMHSIFSHPPAHSGPISFSKVENLKLASGTNKSK